MRRKIIISAFLFLAVSSLFSSDSITLEYRMLKRSNDLDVLFHDDGLAMRILLRQAEQGNFLLENPPSFVLDMDDLVHIGEIQDSSILGAMLSPFSSVDLHNGFVRGKNLKRVEKPSIKPSLSGVAVSFDHLDLITLNPVLNPNSPYGFALIAGSPNVFAGVMKAGQTELGLKGSKKDYQTDWRCSSDGSDTIFTIVGSSCSTKAMGMEIKSHAFIQSSWDRLLGGGSTTSWSLDAKADKMGVAMERTLGGIGPGLKTKDENAILSERLLLELHLGGGDPQMDVSYRADKYPKPVYAGQSQRMTIELKTSIASGHFKFEANHITNYESDCGKQSQTDYVITIKTQDVNLKAKTTLLRPRAQPCTLTESSVQATVKAAKLEVKDSKALLELSMEREIDDCTLRLCIDQDRMVTASLRLKR